MKINLYIITGASGTGKSTIVPILKDELPSNYSVYDYDEILRPYDLSDTWADEVTEKMMEITSKNRQNNITTIFTGLIRPYLVKKYQEKYNVEHIQFCLLDITTEERKKRLKLRKSSMSMSLVGDIEEHEGFRTWINESGYRNITIDVTNLPPKEVVSAVIAWIKTS